MEYRIRIRSTCRLEKEKINDMLKGLFHKNTIIDELKVTVAGCQHTLSKRVYDYIIGVSGNEDTLEKAIEKLKEYNFLSRIELYN